MATKLGIIAPKGGGGPKGHTRLKIRGVPSSPPVFYVFDGDELTLVPQVDNFTCWVEQFIRILQLLRHTNSNA